MDPAIDQPTTDDLTAWATDMVAEPFDTDTPPIELARRLGAHPVDGIVAFGFWIPLLRSNPGAHVELELLEPPMDLDLSVPNQQVTFQRTVLPMSTAGQFAWVSATGVTVGDRDRVGTLYRAIVHDEAGDVVAVQDPLAFSTPFGAFAPAEVVDASWTGADRPDAAYYSTIGSADVDVPRIPPCVNLLQVHVPTATEEGTIAALTEWISDVAERVAAGAELSPGDEVWLEYDGIELMPVEPTIGFEAGPPAFAELEVDDDRLVARLEHLTTTDGGYDIIISGGAAVNPAILQAGRPYELADLAAALHAFPGRSMRLVIDVVYGHADNQAIGVVPDAWFTGPDMYGQHLDYRNPIVRAHLLEMQRRKADFGADGIRIDGAQDFTWWNEDTEQLEYHDRYMQEMSDVVQEIAGTRYRSWMIFEDGRPWPKEDWELSSTYRAVIERQPDVHQWGPLTFAHNTPFLFTFWITKWWRLREIAEVGSTWISGCANHDTLRRGSQVDPEERINHCLGPTLPQVIENAYDHAAANLLFHAFLPGTPMDFLQASVRAPWSFVRNTDHRYAIKVWAEEKRFLDWRVTAEDYANDRDFPRLKELGFENRDALYELMAELEATVGLHGDAIEPAVEAATRVGLPTGILTDADGLRRVARAWMDDVHDYCVATRYVDRLDRARVRFNRDVRAFRRDHRWLADDLGSADLFDYSHPTTGTVVFHGMRTGPDGERVLFVANMEGRPVEVVPTELAGADEEWQTALTAPGVLVSNADEPVILRDAQGVVFVTRR